MLHRNSSRPPKPMHRMPDNPKPKLAATQLPVFRVHFKALESYVLQVFGFAFDFLFAAGVTHGISVDYVVNGVIQGLSWERRARDLRDGRKTGDARLILNVLCHDGYIPKGQYTITTQAPQDPAVQYSKLLEQFRDPKSPACVEFKRLHAQDREFVSRAVILDRAVENYLKDRQSEVE